jgi:membrane protein implicated in regulation of membrane protease activity
VKSEFASRGPQGALRYDRRDSHRGDREARVETYWIWVIAGIALVVAELLSGTFYLLVLGVAAFVAAAVAWFAGPFLAQVVVAGVIAVAGVFWIRSRRHALATPDMAPLDVGQPVTLQSWVSQPDRVARVKYRDALWDAVVDGDARGEAGEVLYITRVDGNTLRVAKQKAG